MKKILTLIVIIITVGAIGIFIPKMVGNKMLSSNVATSSLLNNYDFGYIFQNGIYQTYIGTSWTGGDKGHVNQLYYNFMIDGYGGLPMGSCLQRSMFITNPVEKAKCTPVENSDLFRSDNSSGSPAKNLLIKNVTIKNAFRTGNAWGGTANINGTPVANIYTSPTQLPHVDTFQSYMGVAKKSIWDDVNKRWVQVDDTELNNKPEWMVIQDTVIKNSDNGAMIVGGTWWDGIVYQNLSTFCEPAFATDALARMNNDRNNFVGSSMGGPAPCGNEIGAETFGQSPVWLINVSSGKSVTINNPNKALAGPVIVVGNNTIAGVGVNRNSTQATKEGNILSQYYTNGSWSTPSAHPNVKYYDYIEDALAAGNTRPPYLELSCSGWRNPPAGCETRQGYLNDNTPPPTTSALNVTKSGNGTITSSPAGINCGSDCSETYTIANNTSVTLTANPQSGGTVTWSGACSGSGLTCGPLLMTSNKNVTATLSGPTLPFAIGNKITVQSSTVNVRALPSIQGFLRGTQTQGGSGIILDGPRQADGVTWWYVNYDTGSDGWAGQDTHAVIAENVTQPGDQYTLTSSGANGVITGNLGTYRQGVVAYLTATPNTGYEFVSWTGCTTSTGNICEVTMNSHKNVQAQFQQIPETRVCKPWN